MRERPAELTDAEVLRAVRRAWDTTVSRVEHLPVGFGAHHWRADVAGASRLFVTYDRLTGRHTLKSLAAAYEGAIELAQSGLEFVIAPIRTRAGRALWPIAAGAVSCTPWLDGDVVGDGAISTARTAQQNLADLARLHRGPPPRGIANWTPLVNADFASGLAAVLGRPWDTGPYGQPARKAVAGRLADIDVWTGRYHELAERAKARPWVATHGETHTGNQIRTAEAIRFVDWESLLAAPRERDLNALVRAGYGQRAGADPEMVELFDLEWRLTEIDQYTHWLSAPHDGTADDEIAFDGLLDELSRQPWWPVT